MDWVGVQCQRKHGVVAFGLAGKPRVAFLDSEQGIGQQRGCIDWIEKVAVRAQRGRNAWIGTLHGLAF